MGVFPTTLVFDTLAVNGGARRPSIDDVGKALLEAKAPAPRETGTHLHPDFLNQWQKLLVAFGRVCPSAILTIDFNGGGVPFIDKLQTLSDSLLIADFSVFDDGNGITRIQWTSTKLPDPTCDPSGLTFAGSGLHQGRVLLTKNWSGSGAGASTPGTHRILLTTYLSATDVAAAVLTNVRCTFQIN